MLRWDSPIVFCFPELPEVVIRQKMRSSSLAGSGMCSGEGSDGRSMVDSDGRP